MLAGSQRSWKGDVYFVVCIGSCSLGGAMGVEFVVSVLL